jgi:hypothetical protein
MDLRSQNHFISFARFFVKGLEVVSKPRQGGQASDQAQGQGASRLKSEM